MVHHVPGWVHGSTADVDQMALACGAHHQQIEAGHYRVTMLDGVPYVVPPAWVDPDRAPVRNTYRLAKRAAAALGQQLAIHLGLRDRHGSLPPPPGDGADPPDTG